MFGWEPPSGLRFKYAALDVETADASAVRWMSTRFGLAPELFLERWTATEALAKVGATPILEFLKLKGLAPKAPLVWTLYERGTWLRGIRHPTCCITVAVVL